MTLLANEIFRARLSYQEIESKNPDWDNIMVNDYLGIGQGSLALVEQTDANTLAIEVNAESILVLDGRVTQNEDDIVTIQDGLTDHVLSTSEHGVTGDNVGTEDFCQELIGGVVLLCALVADAAASAAEVTIADVGSAPAAYQQGYADLQTNLINDVKAKHNTMLTDLNNAVAQLNDLIAKMKTAKQMSAT